MRQLFAELGHEQAVQPPQTLTLFPEDRGDFITYLGASTGAKMFGAKLSPYLITPGKPVITAWSMLIADEASIEIAEGQTLRRVRAMHEWRIELTGFNDLGVERLKSMGLISEIVSWKLRLYVPTGAVGGDVLEKLLDRFPVVRVNPRKAA